MTDSPKARRRWLRFTVWEFAIFAALIAALFATTLLVRYTLDPFRSTPNVSLSRFKEQLAAGRVERVRLRAGSDGVTVGLADLTAPVPGEKPATGERRLRFLLAPSDDALGDLLKQMEEQGVAFEMSTADSGWYWIFPTVGTLLFVLFALVLLRLTRG